MKFLTIFCLFNINYFSHAADPEVSISKATELAVHRIERLVTLKKLDPIFLLAITSLEPSITTENSAKYKIIASLIANDEGSQHSVTLWQDKAGKTLLNETNNYKDPQNYFIWPDKDAATLMEEGLHFILEGWVKNPEIKVFFEDLKKITLTNYLDNKNQLFAKFVATSNSTKDELIYYLKTDGTFVSFEIKKIDLALQPTFKSIEQNILKVKCQVCHSNTGSVHWIPLVTYSDLLDSPLDIIIPNKPDESGIILMTTSADPKKQMPPQKDKLGNPTNIALLTQSEVDAISLWINAGAKM